MQLIHLVPSDDGQINSIQRKLLSVNINRTLGTIDDRID